MQKLSITQFRWVTMSLGLTLKKDSIGYETVFCLYAKFN